MSRFLDPFQRWKMGFRDAFFVVILIFFCFSRNNAEALGFVKGMVEWVGSSKSNVFKPRRSYIQMVLSIFSFPSQLLWVGHGVVWELESARARRGRHPQRSEYLGRSVSVRVGGSSKRTKDLLHVSASAVPKGNEAWTLDKTRERLGPFTLASSWLHTLWND